jgi:hypothetical protein
MHLKDAKAEDKLEKFISEREKTHPKASQLHFHATVKSMAAGKKKAKKGASGRASRAS